MNVTTKTTQTLVIVIEDDNPDFAREALGKAITRIDGMRPAPVVVT